MQVSSDLQLGGGNNRAEGKLAVRSVVWLKLKKAGTLGPMVYMMCTHITGGRFEDQYFVQQLAQERFRQPERIIEFFNNRPDPREDDVGMLLGDFNATTEYTPDGPMHGYFKSGIMTSPGVQADAAAVGLDPERLSEHFKRYMISPFTAMRKHGWTLAYNQEQIGATSSFGHLIDHMVMSRPLEVVSAKVMFLTNQKIGNKPKDTELPLTDHNAVQTIFGIPVRAGTDLPSTEHSTVKTSFDSQRGLLPTGMFSAVFCGTLSLC
jgi:endonuclease/exonuclease/phosphatase family metal-dependent hydrolase